MNFTEVLQSILYVVIIGVLPVIVGYGVKYLKVWANILIEKSDNDTLDSYIKTAYNMIVNIVTSVNQTYVDSLKESGSFSSEAQEEAKKLASTKAIALISEEAIEAIEKVYGDFNTWMDTTIEAVVKKLKEY